VSTTLLLGLSLMETRQGFCAVRLRTNLGGMQLSN